MSRSPSIPVLSFLVLGALAAAAGANTPASKLSSTAGGLARLDPGDRFGASVASIGDLDGNGTPDIAVGAKDDDDGGKDRGAVHVLFLDATGTVLRQQKISDTAGGFLAGLDDGDLFGSAVAGIGDLDGDGVGDLVVGAPGDDDGASGAGAVYVISLDSTGMVKRYQKISNTTGGLPARLDAYDSFGTSVASLGDVDADSLPDIAVGASNDDDGGTNRGCIRVIALHGTGLVRACQKISQEAGGFLGALPDGCRFGASIAALGDLDGDGMADLAVGAFLDGTGGPERGAVWIVFLTPFGTVKGQQKIAHATGGFPGVLDDGDGFGVSLAGVSDRNHDGIQDLAVGAFADDDAGLDRGAVWVLNLLADGTVRGARKLSAQAGRFAGSLDDGDLFGRSLCELPDMNGDGWDELVVGATGDDDGAAEAGAVWKLEVRARAQGSTVFRNGSGTNPATLVPLNTPEIGTIWLATIDVATPGALLSLLQVGDGGPTQGIHLSGLAEGELLILPPYPKGLLDIAVGRHSVPIPDDPAFVGLALSVQGATLLPGFSRPGFLQLTNALDLTVGTY